MNKMDFWKRIAVVIVTFSLIAFVIFMPSLMVAIFYGGMVGTDMLLTNQYSLKFLKVRK